MAGTVTNTETTIYTVKKIVFDWLSGTGDDAGAASSASTNYFTGLIQRVVQIPDAAATQPTAAYDVVVNDDDGVDVLHGLGANLANDATTVKDYTDGLGAVVNSKLALAVTNAGDAKGGKTIIYLR